MKNTLLLLAALVLSPAAFSEDNAARLALAREALAAMQLNRMFDGMAAQMKQAATQMTAVPDSVPAEKRQQLLQFQDKAVNLVMEEMKLLFTKADSVYAEVYSEAELRAMIAFFKSTEGQSMLAKQPQVMARVMPLVQEMQQSMRPKLQALAEEMRTAVKQAQADSQATQAAAPAK